MSKTNELESVPKKGRTPKDYKSWLMWEVALPLAAPLAVFFVLLGYWGLTHTPHFGVRALLSVAGSGDLYIFAAFLLFNVAAKFRALAAKEPDQREYFIDGEVDPDGPFWIAICFLLIYMGARVGFEIMDTREVVTYKFIYSSLSAIFILIALVWIDILVCKIYLSDLKRRESIGLVSNYYNAY